MLSATSILLAVAAVGIQFGSESLPGGGNKYIVQVEPELIDTFRQDGFASDVPPGLRDIRRIEIRVGTGALPNQGLTVLKVPSRGAADASKPPRLDAAPTEPASKQPVVKEAPKAARDEPKVAANDLMPKQLPTNVSAGPLNSSGDKTAERTSFQASERPSPREDDGPSAATATPGAQPGKSDNRQSPSTDETDSASSRDPEKPWIPFLGALGALIVSAAGNVYLGWVHLGTRRRYRDVVDQLRETDLPIAISPHTDL